MRPLNVYRRPMPPRAALPLLIAALCVGQGVAAWLLGGGDAAPVELALGALWTPDPWGHEAYRLLSATFVHLDAGHLASNLLMGLVLSGWVLLWFDVWRWLFLWTAAGVGGSVASALSNQGSLDIGMGASTSLWGLMGACLGLWLRQRLARRRGTPASDDESAMVVGLFLFVLPNLLYALAPSPGRAGHLGGGLTGLALVGLGLVVPAPEGGEASLGVRALGALCAALCVGSVVAAWTLNRPWTLRDPAPWVVTSLGVPGVSASLPARLALRSGRTDTDGRVLRFFGRRPFDWLRVHTRVETLDEPVPEDEVAAWLQALEDADEPSLTWSGPSALVSVAGRPARRRAGTFADKDRLIRYVLVKGARLVVLEVQLLPETTGAWADPEPIAASIRWEE